MIKSPLNYTGGKYKLLPQLLQHFPKNIDVFYDVFGGGGNVTVNVDANKYIYNDLQPEVVELLNYFKLNNNKEIVNDINAIISEFDLSRENKEGYLALRSRYNESKNPEMFYTLICHSFSNQIRFNSKGGFNLPFGKRTFNDSMKGNLESFVERLHNINIDFWNKNFMNIDIRVFSKEDFVYLDPPYLISEATYNDKWNEVQENYLHKFCDELHNNEIKFALSNVSIHKGLRNELLLKWADKYRIIELDFDYKNCNYHKKDRDSKTHEILVVNY